MAVRCGSNRGRPEQDPAPAHARWGRRSPGPAFPNSHDSGTRVVSPAQFSLDIPPDGGNEYRRSLRDLVQRARPALESLYICETSKEVNMVWFSLRSLRNFFAVFAVKGLTWSCPKS